jgi:succinyl-diaminopimelate desuccinylase
VVIAGHIDTVPVASNLPVEKRSVEASDGSRVELIWGRGTVDMKLELLCRLKLAAKLVNPNVDLTYIFYDNEEVDASLNGLGRLARNRPDLLEADFAILCEPTSARIRRRFNGTMRVEVVTQGVKAHSARPWMGSMRFTPLRARYKHWLSHTPLELEVDGLLYRESLNAVLVSGGIAANVIPDECVITVNYRFCAESVAPL